MIKVARENCCIKALGLMRTLVTEDRKLSEEDFAKTYGNETLYPRSQYNCFFNFPGLQLDPNLNQNLDIEVTHIDPSWTVQELKARIAKIRRLKKSGLPKEIEIQTKSGTFLINDKILSFYNLKPGTYLDVIPKISTGVGKKVCKKAPAFESTIRNTKGYYLRGNTDISIELTARGQSQRDLAYGFDTPVTNAVCKNLCPPNIDKKRKRDKNDNDDAYDYDGEAHETNHHKLIKTEKEDRKLSEEDDDYKIVSPFFYNLKPGTNLDVIQKISTGVGKNVCKKAPALESTDDYDGEAHETNHHKLIKTEHCE